MNSTSMWSPGIGSNSNLGAPNEFKINFDGPLSQTSSPLFGPGGANQNQNHPSMRHKKKYDNHGEYDSGSNNDIGSNEPHEILYNNRQALAERLKYSAVDSSGGLGIAEAPSSSRHIPSYLGSSLALDVGSPTPVDSISQSIPVATGRGARERKATPKSRGQTSYGKAAGAGDSTKAQARLSSMMMNTNTPTAEFLDMGISTDRGPLTCNCKKSRCLKLYCECFHALKFCQNCKCYDCENRPGNDNVRNSVIATIKERDPHAFESKVRLDDGSGAKGHLSGCHCKRTSCLKKYCECFTLAVPCTQRCRCLKCQNNASLYQIKTTEAKYTAAMLVSAAASAIDSAGGDEYLMNSKLDTSSEEGGYASGTARSSVSSRTGRMSPDSDKGSRNGGYAGNFSLSNTGPIPASPNGMSLLDLAGACTEQEKHEEAREGLLALSPQRPTTTSRSNADMSRVQPLSARLNMDREA